MLLSSVGEAGARRRRTAEERRTFAQEFCDGIKLSPRSSVGSVLIVPRSQIREDGVGLL